MHYLESLNQEQKTAVLKTDGPVLIVAGAGTGKTKTITCRIHNLIETGICEPKNILAITFTNKAAKEMKERVNHLRGNFNPEMPFISTFHGLGAFLIRLYAPALGLQKSFTILDQDDANSLLRQTMKKLDIDIKQWEPKKILGRIDRQKGELFDIKEINQQSLSAWDDITNQVWQEYEREKQKENSLDFGDLLLKTYQLLRDNDKIRNDLQNLWKYIHIDEYQDTNKAQYEIVKLLTGQEKNICAVGDGDQNIYTWRGADVRNILRFEKDFPGSTVIILETNYRSTKPILSAAEEVIRKNKKRIDKKLVSHKGDGEKITIYRAMNENDEARFVANEISNLVDKDADPSSIAILFRTNFQSRVLEEAMINRNIPYKLLGVRFFERKEVKDLLSYIRSAINPDSSADLSRSINTPKRGIGKVSIVKILSGNEDSLSGKTKDLFLNYKKILSDIKNSFETKKTSEIIKFAIERSGLFSELSQENTEESIERLANLKELVSVATKYDHLSGQEGIEALIQDASLASEQDGLSIETKNIPAITMMTVHAAKGLEFETVFVVGMEQGLFPSIRDGLKKEDDEEERRLFYVAITRAKDKLYLTHAFTRRIFGSETYQTPSEFLLDIPDELIINDESENPPIKTIYLDF